MKTIVVVSVHHQARYIYSSKDFNGYRMFNSLTEANEFIDKYELTPKSYYVDKDLGINIVYIKSFEYDNRRGEMEILFIEGLSEDVESYWNKQGDLKNEKKRKQGYVIHKDVRKLTLEDYKGSLSENLLTDITMNYISSSIVCGYLGHSARKHIYDKIINDIIKNVIVTIDGQEINKWNLISTWLTSTDARHYMDQMEGKTNEEFYNAFIKKLNDIMKLGYVYSLDEHEGTWGSTENLLNKYENRIKVDYQ